MGDGFIRQLHTYSSDSTRAIKNTHGQLIVHSCILLPYGVVLESDFQRVSTAVL